MKVFTKKMLVASALMTTFIGANAATCKFNLPSIPDNVCQSLNTKPDISKNPYYMKNPNANGCTLSLSGLPELDLNVDGLAAWTKLPDLCSLLKNYTGGDVVNKLRSILG